MENVTFSEDENTKLATSPIFNNTKLVDNDDRFMNNSAVISSDFLNDTNSNTPTYLNETINGNSFFLNETTNGNSFFLNETTNGNSFFPNETTNINNPFFLNEATANSSFILNETTSNNSAVELPFYLRFRNEPWVIPLVAFALFNVVVILFFEIYVLYKSCGGRRHLFLGQILLLGLLFCSVLGLLYIPEPHWLFCGITRAGVGLAYTMVFGTLFVKCVFLLKIHDGIYFNSSLQGLLLFFIVATEVSIMTMWLVYEPSGVNSASNFEPESVICNKGPLDRVKFLTYPMFLMVLVIIASIRARSLRENNKEARYIGLSIAFTLVLWVAWMSTELIFDWRYEAPAEAFGLVSTALVVFVLIFIPKAIHLAAQARRDEKNRSDSRSVLQTPSFLHLQPHAVLPSSTQGTLVKPSSNVNADYCRGYAARVWRYDYPSIRQSEPLPIVNSDYNSLKKSNGSPYQTSMAY